MDPCPRLGDEELIDFARGEAESLQQCGKLAQHEGMVPGPADGLVRPMYGVGHEAPCSLSGAPAAVEQVADSPVIVRTWSWNVHRGRGPVGAIGSGALGMAGAAANQASSRATDRLRN